MDACWQQWPCQQYWRFYHKNHDLLIFRTVIGLHLLKLRWKKMSDDDEVQFFCLLFCVVIFLNILIWIHYFHRDNCFAQCVAIIGSQPNFFSITLERCLHPLRYHDKSLSHCVNGHVSHFFNHYNSISTQFSQLQMWKHLFRWLYCRRLFDLLVDTWSLVYRMIDKGFIRLMFLIIILPWLRF